MFKPTKVNKYQTSLIMCPNRQNICQKMFRGSHVSASSSLTYSRGYELPKWSAAARAGNEPSRSLKFHNHREGHVRQADWLAMLA